MKKTYTSPRLTEYGNLETLKKLFGKPSETLVVKVSNANVPPSPVAAPTMPASVQ
jgi:hypothetical protein